jgi:sulfide dehydrogenase [flavocytochrome c] flavoprotein subunit
MPKSAFSASTQGKVVALQIARMLKQQEPLNPPKLANTCYSLLVQTMVFLLPLFTMHLMIK